MRMQELRYTTTVKERFEGELNAARSIQMSLVPKHFPAFPGRPELDVHALLRPAREIGGDLYDFYFLDEEWLCFLIVMCRARACRRRCSWLSRKRYSRRARRGTNPSRR